ncbi:erythromycin esterase family protein [Wenjunlia vitaminophila]|uniref:erythromycin esterase family protein n=1 Tax=Wenjunlia vitaminophila TaxID=76728 RepID=UPI000593D6CD|nr:erythromycin esterase family protein [Wenjunlia vitaminophila]
MPNHRRLSASAAALLLAVLSVLCVPPARAGGASPDPVVAALTRAAHPLRTTEPTGGTADLAPLGRAVGSSVIVSVGEATHGSHQFFTLQDRVFRYLVRHKHFTSFAREAGWNAGQRINDWVLTGRGDIRQIMREVFQSSDRLWNNQEYLDLFRWMRAHNVLHARKVQFTGNDIAPVEPQLYDRVLDYVARELPELYPAVEELYSGHPTGSVLAATREFTARPQDERLDLARRAQQVYALLKAHRPARYSAAFEWVLQDARVIAQDTRFYSFDSSDDAQLIQQDLYRDSQMAANLTWWYEHTRSKTLLAAHDGHVAYVSNSPYYPRPEGAFLRDQFGKRYTSIRTSFGGGSFLAYDADSVQTPVPLDVFTVGPPAPDSNEYTLNKVPYRDYLLDLRTVRPPARKWLTVARPTYEIGVLWPVPLPDTALRPSSDLLIHLRHVDAAHLLPE